jgi:hypothetical protein
MKTLAEKRNAVRLKPIIWIGLLTGTLDAIAAMIENYKITPAIIFEFIASGVFGKAAFTGSTTMVLWGIFFHYLIAWSFSAVLFMMFPLFIKFLKNKYITAVLFALITWLITNLIIVPASRIGWHPIPITSILTGYGILIISIGLPIALVADKFYSKKVRDQLSCSSK